jgi:ketosteroid isomerase-like protein
MDQQLPQTIPLRTELLSDIEPTGIKVEVERRMDGFGRAIRQGDLDEMMSYFAADVVAFDIMPPLQFTDAHSYRNKAWKGCFTDCFTFPVVFDFHEQQIFGDGDVVFTHALIHMNGTQNNGVIIDNWLRSTICWARIHQEWKITHMHTSVPQQQH